MSDVDGTCEYVLDPDDPDTWGGEEGDECYVDEELLNEDDVWTCPHDAEEGGDICIFHLSVEEKEDSRVVNEFLRVVGDSVTDSESKNNECKWQFIGANFGDFDVSDADISIAGTERIDFSHSKFFEGLEFLDVIFEQSFIAKGITSEKAIVFRDCKLQGGISINGGNINNSIDLRESTISGGIPFREGAFSCLEVSIDRDLDFNSSEITDNVYIGLGSHGAGFDSKIDGRVIFHDATVEGGIFLDWTEADSFVFTDADIKGGISSSKATIDTNVYLTSANIGKSLNIEQTSIGGDISFLKSTIEGNISIIDSKIEGLVKAPKMSLDDCSFSETEANQADFWKSDLTNADLSGASIQGANLERAILNRSDLFGARIEGTAFYGAVAGDAQINEETDFGDYCVYDPNFDDGKLSDIKKEEPTYPSSLADAIKETSDRFDDFEERAKSDLKEGTYDEETVMELPKPEDIRDIHAGIEFSRPSADKVGELTKAAGQYRIIERLARTNAFPDMVSHNFIRRKDIHREQHRHEGRWGRWLRATASKYVLEYGENPWRLIATGLIIVVGFGLLYPLVGGLQPTGGSPITLSRTINNPVLLLQSIYYSTLTFTTLGMGDFLPVRMGKVLTTLETSIGAIIIALLVFVFGRRAAR